MLPESVGARLHMSLRLQLLAALLPLLTTGALCSSEHFFGNLHNGSHSSIRTSGLRQHVQTLLRKCPLPGYCIRDRGLPGPSKYLHSSPVHAGIQRQRKAVAGFLEGSGFQARLQQLQQLPDRRGILISAGKPHHIGNAAVMLHILRRQYNCTLTVEVAHRGDEEVDNVTRTALAEAFPPLRWLDLNQQPYPAHHNQDYTMDRYEPKIYALYHSSFQQVLMLDADNLPLKDPSYLFDAPHMTRHGVMMWLDLWDPGLSSTTFVGHDSVYPLVGLNKQAYWDALAGGQGYLRRVAESGQLVMDRVRHADVLEWLWMYTSYSQDLYRHILGDKDTFGYAFAAARKLHDLHAVAVPPGIALTRTPKADGQLDWWHFHAMTQYDHLGGVVFFHRTLEKWMDVRKMPPMMDVQTGPLPNWFILSYLGNTSSSLTPDMPGHVLQPLAPPPSCSSKAPRSTYINSNSFVTSEPLNLHFGRQHGGCQLGVYLQVLELKALGLPLAETPELEKACRQHLALTPHGMRILQSDSSPSGRSTKSTEHAALRDTRTGQAGGSDTSSTAAPNGFFSLMNERVWLRNCIALRKATSAPQADSSNNTASDSVTDVGSSGVLEANHGRRFLEDAAQAKDRESATSSSGRRRHRRSKATSSSWPRCDKAHWHVTRYMLPEFAQQVGKDVNGQPAPYAAAILPVLQLVSSSAPYDAAATLVEAVSTAASDSSSAAARMPSGCGSHIDFLQRVSLPAAVQWVTNNIEKLPYLHG